MSEEWEKFKKMVMKLDNYQPAPAGIQRRESALRIELHPDNRKHLQFVEMLRADMGAKLN